MPDDDTLRKCFLANPDGMGFKSETKECKTMSFREFKKELKNVGRDEACMIHFRLATHGSVAPKNCHPFTDDNTGISFAHNGVLPIPSKNDMTDSEICFRTMLMPVINKYGLDSKQLDNAVWDVIGSSKFAFMKDGKIKSYGDFKRINGVYYSNLRWQRNLYYTI